MVQKIVIEIILPILNFLKKEAKVKMKYILLKVDTLTQ